MKNIYLAPKMDLCHCTKDVMCSSSYKLIRGSGNGLYLYLICICFSEKSTRDQSREVYLLIDNILVKNDLLYETLLVKICFFTRLFS